MTAAALAMAYAGFKYDATGVVTNLTDTFLKPILRQAADSIDVASGFAGLIPFSSAAEAAAKSYDRNLTKGKWLHELPVKPIFVFNATSLMTGNAVRFGRNYVADYRVGQLTGVKVRLADVVADRMAAESWILFNETYTVAPVFFRVMPTIARIPRSRC